MATESIIITRLQLVKAIKIVILAKLYSIKVSYINTRKRLSAATYFRKTTHLMSFWCRYYQLWTHFTLFYSVSIAVLKRQMFAGITTTTTVTQTYLPSFLIASNKKIWPFLITNIFRFLFWVLSLSFPFFGTRVELKRRPYWDISNGKALNK